MMIRAKACTRIPLISPSIKKLKSKSDGSEKCETIISIVYYVFPSAIVELENSFMGCTLKFNLKAVVILLICYSTDHS